MIEKRNLRQNDLLLRIDKWKIEASSPHNDGWTQQYYKRMLDEVKRDLNKVLYEIKEYENSKPTVQ